MVLATFDSKSIQEMMNNFVLFYKDGKYTVDGMFDIGISTREALENYIVSGDYTKCARSNEYACGNGALMRIFPLLPLIKNKDFVSKFQIIKSYSLVTHNHKRVFLANYIYLRLMELLIDEPKKCLKHLLTIKNELENNIDKLEYLENEDFNDFLLDRDIDFSSYKDELLKFDKSILTKIL